MLNYTARAESSKDDPLFENDKLGLLDSLHKDRLSANAYGPAESNLKTWLTYHVRWYGNSIPAFPMSCESMEAVAAQMKQDKYRSFQNYLSRAKYEHIRKGFVWDQLLDITGKSCTASLNRGIGAGKQSAAYSIISI